ncbi:alanine racemase [Microbacterium paludicola]|uniref:alanine racemase n=1 Tax=Microbacterium paludicola TaxID=300019 RepID=UPI0021B556D1|nr:alanine racemase [Microbacterium paludicola]
MDGLMTPVLELSAERLARNVEAVRRRIAPSVLMLAMKDDAYGHGVEWVLDALSADPALDRFGSFDVETGERVRARRPHARVFAWATSTDEEIARALDAGLELGIGDEDYLRRVLAVARDRERTAAVHLKIDTGLHRNGVRPERWPAFVAAVDGAQRAGLLRVVGLWSHLAEASDAEDDAAAGVFRHALEVLRAAGIDPADTHLTASAASWWRPELRASVCRIGAFCYGIRSADGPDIPGIGPVATLSAPVIDARADTVDVGIGALHGFPSNLVGAPVGTPAGPRAIRAIGDTRMTVDAWSGASRGDAVTIFGPGDHGEPDATALAERIDTVGEEIVTRLTPAVRRIATR